MWHILWVGFKHVKHDVKSGMHLSKGVWYLCDVGPQSLTLGIYHNNPGQVLDSEVLRPRREILQPHPENDDVDTAYFS